MVYHTSAVIMSFHNVRFEPNDQRMVHGYTVTLSSLSDQRRQFHPVLLSTTAGPPLLRNLRLVIHRCFVRLSSAKPCSCPSTLSTKTFAPQSHYCKLKGLGFVCLSKYVYFFAYYLIESLLYFASVSVSNCFI